MASSWWSILAFFKINAEDEIEGADKCLKLTRKCLEQAELMTHSASSSRKFHREQCEYLVNKLSRAFESASLFNGRVSRWHHKFPTPQPKVEYLEVFKGLLGLSMEVERLIQGCCRDKWIQSAIMLTNISEHVLSLGFNLEVCQNIFTYRKSWTTWQGLTTTEVGRDHNAQIETVKMMASSDAETLRIQVESLIESSKPSSAEYELATFLCKKIRTPVSPVVCEVSFDEGGIMSIQEFRSKLGEGASASVHKATWLGAEVAVKRFHGLENPDFKKEVSILGGLCHPNIISFHCYGQDNGECSIVMELMDGDLQSLIRERFRLNRKQRPPFSKIEEVETMLQVAQGMCYLHEMRIVHRDLKSLNILVRCLNASEVGNGDMQIKVADFGLSKTKERSMTYSNQTPNIGTARWLAPEMIKFQNGNSAAEISESEAVVAKYPFKVDVYSFAMVCYEILSGDLPFSCCSNNEVKRKVVDGERPQLPSQCPEKLRTLIEACWSQEPSRRPSFGDICAELRLMKCILLIEVAWAEVPGA